jgi:RNA polymerase sigma factor (sigma-70 family)
MNQDLRTIFQDILDNNKYRILRICRAYANGSEDQKDLFQDVLLNIWKSLPTFRGESNIKTWVFRICMNVCMQHSLKLKKNTGKNFPVEGLEIFDQDHDIDRNLENAEQTRKLYACIAKLNDIDKSIVLLFLEDLPYRIIAGVTGITENNIAVRVSRIKNKLFNCLNE